jgi:hypothetical protein
MIQILLESIQILKKEKSLFEVTVKENEKITVCGDVIYLLIKRHMVNIMIY